MLIPIVLFSKRYFPLPISFFVLSSRLGLAGGGSLEGLLAPQLGLGVGLDGELGLADGGGTLDGGRTEVSAVAGLGDLAGNGLVGLAGGLAATNGGGSNALGGLVDGSSLLADDNNAALLTGGDTNSLVVDKASVLAAVLVGQVKGVARQLDTAI